MAIVIRLDRVLADRKMQLTQLASRIGITLANLSNLKTGKVRAIRFTTLDAICRELGCQPGDILEYEPSIGEEEWETMLTSRTGSNSSPGSAMYEIEHTTGTKGGAVGGRFLYSHTAEPRHSVTYCSNRQEVVAVPSNSDTVKDMISSRAIEHIPISDFCLTPNQTHRRLRQGARKLSCIVPLRRRNGI